MTEHLGAATDTVFLSALCQLMPKYKMYVAAEVVFGFRGNKRLVVLDHPGTFYRFELEVDSFLVKFKLCETFERLQTTAHDNPSKYQEQLAS
jgi:hypothetical protein